MTEQELTEDAVRYFIRRVLELRPRIMSGKATREETADFYQAASLAISFGEELPEGRYMAIFDEEDPR
jgi:hypothetical protein